MPYEALESLNEIHCLKSTGNFPTKKPDLRLTNPICLSPLELKVSPGHLDSTDKRSPYITPKHTHTATHLHKYTEKNNNTMATNLTTRYTLCDVKTEETIRHNIALMTSTTRVYIFYPFGTIIK